MKVRYSRRAAHDLESIREYLNKRSVRRAANVLAAIYLSIEFIRRNPQASEKTALPPCVPRQSVSTALRYFTALRQPMMRSRLFTCVIRLGAHGAVKTTEDFPASAGITVAGFVRPQMMLETQCVAVV